MSLEPGPHHSPYRSDGKPTDPEHRRRRPDGELADEEVSSREQLHPCWCELPERRGQRQGVERKGESLRAGQTSVRNRDDSELHKII